MDLPFDITRPTTLLLIVVLLPVVVFFFMRTLSDFPQKQQRTSFVIRILILLLIVLSLSGISFLRTVNDQYVVYLIDESLSVGDENEKRIEEFLKESAEVSGKHRVSVLKFASTAGPIEEGISSPDGKDSSDGSSESANKGNQADSDQAKPVGADLVISRDDPRNGTNLADAIESAAGFLPPGYVHQLVVISDGNETQGDALQAAIRSKIPISTVPLPARTEPEVQISKVQVPAEVREGEPFNVEVIIDSNHDDEGLIEVYRGDYKVIGERQKLTKGENRFVFPQSVERERLAAYSVRVSGLSEDTLVDNNQDTGLVFMSGKPRVLVIESDPNLIRDLAYALEDQGITVDVRPPQGMPTSLTDLQNYELLVVSNVPATDLTQRQMEVARTFVQELGGGFIMLGGEQSFGLGGYYKSTLEEILPVRSDFEKEKEKPSLAMVLVVDKSGSMDGDKIEMAKSAARSAVELLGDRDQVCVLAFDGSTYMISEMQKASNKGAINDDIGQIAAGGGTTMYPAMEMAYDELMNASAKLKHAIFLTDGISQPGDFEGLAQLMSTSKMTVSTVAVGSGADNELLENIARVGRGRHYFTEDPSMIPQIFAKETVTASKSAIDEQPFLPLVIRASHALADVDMNSAPFLLGYVITRPKPTSEVILATEAGDPLLAWWRYGLGMTAAFTSDAKTRWAAEWMSWPGFGKFWTQVIRHCMRKSDAQGIAVDLARTDESTKLSIDAVDTLGQFLNDSNVELAVIDPSLKRTIYEVSQTAPGKYETDVPTKESGAYHFEINVQQNGQSLYRQSRGMVVGYSEELRIQPTNESLLRSLASTTGGTYAPAPKDVFEQEGVAQRPTPLWPYFLIAAIILFIVDVALRRVDFSLHWPFRKIATARA